MTSHNRRDKTLNALNAVKSQRGLLAGTSLHVHLVDAGSTDGTPQAVRSAHPDVRLVTVTDDVYWGTGMRLASLNSVGRDLKPWDYQLWLNDDVTLDEDALAVLLTTADRVGSPSIVVGAVRAHEGTNTTYSGRRGRRLAMVEPTGRPEPCDTYNGNVVLISRAAHDRVGDIDAVFRHGMGDYDHGFRARRVGIPAYVAPRHVGRCDAHPLSAGSREPGIGVREALRRRVSQREHPPRQWWVYCRRHCWPWAPLLMVSPYIKTALRAWVAR
ncbi:glycosyltransferase family 2 protein [Streptomyces violascens]|uniref:glycosyltransferase family 2 protein n=1 Tax=Streptomyces violascens TaxID=67381 RepID=UPI00368B7CA1